MPRKKILILGVSGMLGSRMYKYFYACKKYETYGTVRQIESVKKFFDCGERKNIIANIDARNFDAIARTIKKIKPDVTINCIGVIKQSKGKSDMLSNIELNALLPHKVAEVCEKTNSRLIHVSTDCVFTGKKGFYGEDDAADSIDLYGATKRLGEVSGRNQLTIRTSIIGHEISNKTSLLEWFLSQKNRVSGYSKAIFSGFPTIALCRIFDEYILNNRKLYGLYHVSSEPISKYKLLKIIRSVYGKEIEIDKDAAFKCNRALNSARFRKQCGFKPDTWENYIKEMHEDYKKTYKGER